MLFSCFKRSNASRRIVRALSFKNDFESEAFQINSLVLSAAAEKPRREVMRKSVEKLMFHGKVALEDRP